jgi:predicted ArsR family transcriptional regulator
MEPWPPPIRRTATAAEVKAQAHPLRLRILRLCLDEALTNRELAQRLDRDPATVLHHVRRLVDTGFLEAEPVRPGRRGAREKPYRATGKSITLEVTDPTQVGHLTAAALEATRQELAEGGDDTMTNMTRLALHLDPASRDELYRRLTAVVAEYVDQPPRPGTAPHGFLLVIHPRG